MAADSAALSSVGTRLGVLFTAEEAALSILLETWLSVFPEEDIFEASSVPQPERDRSRKDKSSTGPEKVGSVF